MTHAFSRRIASWLPARWRSEVRRLYFARQIASGTFVSPEPEFNLLANYVGEGNWVIDIGANVGHYTKRLSDLVGTRGRVIAFEPVPETFAVLATNVRLFANANITLINAAASDGADVVGMAIPRNCSGEANFYQAHIADAQDSAFAVLAIRVDTLEIPNPVTLIKIDAEGHEGHALLGMQALIVRDRPVLVLEAGAREATDLLKKLGYSSVAFPDSPNIVFLPPPLPDGGHSSPPSGRTNP